MRHTIIIDRASNINRLRKSWSPIHWRRRMPRWPRRTDHMSRAAIIPKACYICHLRNNWSPCRLALGVPMSVKRMKQYLSNARQLATTVMLDRMQPREESGQDSGFRALGLLTTLCSGLAPAPPSATIASSSRVGVSMPCCSHLLPRPEKDYQDPGEFNGVL